MAEIGFGARWLRPADPMHTEPYLTEQEEKQGGSVGSAPSAATTLARSSSVDMAAPDLLCLHSSYRYEQFSEPAGAAAAEGPSGQKGPTVLACLLSILEI